MNANSIQRPRCWSRTHACTSPCGVGVPGPMDGRDCQFRRRAGSSPWSNQVIPPEEPLFTALEQTRPHVPWSAGA
jgi:hypothetical protein